MIWVRDELELFNDLFLLAVKQIWFCSRNSNLYCILFLACLLCCWSILVRHWIGFMLTKQFLNNNKWSFKAHFAAPVTKAFMEKGVGYIQCSAVASSLHLRDNWDHLQLLCWGVSVAAANWWCCLSQLWPKANSLSFKERNNRLTKA